MNMRDILEKPPEKHCRLYDPKGADRLVWKLYWRLSKPLALLGCVKVIGWPGLEVFVVEKGGKAVAHIYVGKTWLWRGRSWGKTLKFERRVPALDGAALSHARG